MSALPGNSIPALINLNFKVTELPCPPNANPMP